MTLAEQQNAIATAVKSLSMQSLKVARIRELAPTATDEQIHQFLAKHGINATLSAKANWEAMLLMLIERIGKPNILLCRLAEEIPCHAADSTIRHHLLRLDINIESIKRESTKDAIRQIMLENAHRVPTKTDIRRLLKKVTDEASKTGEDTKLISPQMLNGFLKEIELEQPMAA